MGVVERRYIEIFIIIISFSYSTCINLALFFQQHPYILLSSFFNLFFVLVYVILCNIANVAQRIFEIVQKLRSHEHDDIIIWTRTYVDCACM